MRTATLTCVISATVLFWSMAVGSKSVSADDLGRSIGTRPATVVPFGDNALILDQVRESKGQRTAKGGSGSGVQSGADHVMNQQCGDGG